MIRKIFLITILLILSQINLAFSRPVLSALNNNLIEIDAKFQGTNLLLFGAQNATGDVVVIIYGPKQDYLIRKKEKTFGVWLNRQQVKFADVDEFYAIYSSMDFNKLQNSYLLKNLNIGIENLSIKSSGKINISEIDNFRKALVNFKLRDGLYNKTPGKIEFMGDTLFKSNLTFPKKIVKGKYHAELYLINDHEISAVQMIPFNVKKVGFEAILHNLAHDHPHFYAIIAILSALFAGWLASVVFHKR